MNENQQSESVRNLDVGEPGGWLASRVVLGNRMKPKYCAVFGNKDTSGERFVGLTETQLVRTVIDRGMHRLLSVTPDDQSSGEIRPLEGKEMLSIWKRVYRMILERKRHAKVKPETA